MSGTFAQIGAVTALNLRTLPERWQTAAVTVVGIAGVMLVIVGVFSIYEGFRKTLQLSASEDVAMILRGGSSDELSSGLEIEAARVVSDAPGVARDAAGPLVSTELYVSADIKNRATGSSSFVPIRGVTEQSPKLRRAFRIVEGRYFTSGSTEVIVGRRASTQYVGLGLGAVLELGPNRWQIVGIFDDDGSVSESEIWADLRAVQDAYDRGATFQSIRARLASPAAFRQFKDALTSDPRVNLRIQTEREFYEHLSSALRTIVLVGGVTVGLLMGIGAIFGALNTMYAAVAARTREIATLRAMGFGALPVTVSVLAEALLLGATGAVIGALIAYLAFNGLQTSTLNFVSFTAVTFAFTVTLPLTVGALLYALALSLVGGLLPAWRAARLPITTGLREL
ncbi:MAG TPA: ABC transporter permease [Steroidobacteraceae bacterium]|nr:ABC transporter permease [Steroidobacteraceae bacterium]